MMTVAEWYEAAPKPAKEWFESVVVCNFIEERRRAAFNTPGAYDGAISKECKELYHQEYKMLTELQAAIRRPAPA